jgi:hypothetical protein
VIGTPARHDWSDETMANSDGDLARPGRRDALLGIFFLVLLLAACGGAASAPDYGGGAAGPTAAPGAPGGAATAVPNGQSGNGGGSGMGSSATAAPGNGAPVLDATRPELLVVKTGTLVLEVKDVDAAVADAAGRIAGLGGYVAGSSQSGAGDQVTASITYRVPAARWEDALLALRGLAAKVISEQTQTEDVTGQVVDLAARVRNLEATERAVQEVMDKATTIDEILEVQAELTRIRGEIEGVSSTKGHFEEQATYSTLTARFEAVPAPAPSATPEPTPIAAAFDAGDEANRATETLVAILERLAAVGIWFGIVWLPILLVLAAVGLAAWAVVRRRLPPARVPETLPPTA